jgi:transcriptional regulator with PAS, ATPase and Fis domain
MYKLLGLSPNEVQYDANMIDSMISPEDLENTKHKIYTSYLAKKPYQIMYRMRLRNGEVKWIWDQGEVVEDESGELLFLEGIMMDFSEHKALELALKEENRRLQRSGANAYGFGEMVGTSEPMRTLYMQIEKAAQSNSNVLILGETGTGKELCAKTIHELSGRKGAFIPVNCGAIPEQLMESEFFGHTKGAFTGAVSNQEGFLRAAQNGTLFLDEMGELPLHLQVKLLRALESKQFTPVGSNVPQKSTFRLISATHQDLARMVKEKTMRADLYYRINVLAVTVPPLRERNGDISLLIAAYMKEHDIIENVPLSVRIAMEQHSWPGNIRELHNFMERFFMFGRAALEDLESPEADLSLTNADIGLEKAVALFESTMISQAMERCRWKQGAAAKLLGVNLRTFQRKLKLHNIIR